MNASARTRHAVAALIAHAITSVYRKHVAFPAHSATIPDARASQKVMRVTQARQ